MTAVGLSGQVSSWACRIIYQLFSNPERLQYRTASTDRFLYGRPLIRYSYSLKMLSVFYLERLVLSISMWTPLPVFIFTEMLSVFYIGRPILVFVVTDTVFVLTEMLSVFYIRRPVPRFGSVIFFYKDFFIIVIFIQNFFYTGLF